jgi:hypothetical protein
MKSSWNMKVNFIAMMAGIIAVMSLVPLTAAPQPAPAVPGGPALTAEQLDQLVAPIALYPRSISGANHDGRDLPA